MISDEIEYNGVSMDVHYSASKEWAQSQDFGCGSESFGGDGYDIDIHKVVILGYIDILESLKKNDLDEITDLVHDLQL